MAQSTFTAGAHLRELRLTGARSWTILPVSLAFVALVIALSPSWGGEQTYLRFLAFYGLISPAYVLLFLGPGPVLESSRRNLLLFGGFVLAALPFYELGFIHDKLWLLPWPVAGLLVWKMLKLTRRAEHGSRDAG